MSVFTNERDLDHPLSAEVEQTIRRVLEEHLSSQGLEGVLVIRVSTTMATQFCSCISSSAS